MRRRSLLAALVPAAAAARPPTTGAQDADWKPDRVVRFVVGFAPGGSTDTTARVVAQGIAAGLGRSVVVDNRPGAAGNIASAHVARSAPDGHTLIMATTTTHATNPALYRNLPFDVRRDFTPVSLVAFTPNLLVVHPSVQANSVAELIALAKANPGKLNYGSAGPGSSQHLSAALFAQRPASR